MSYDELPGGLGTWRARWLLARHNGMFGPRREPAAARLALAHPAVRGVLVGPHGDRVDARDVIARADREAPGSQTLRDWLAPPAAND